MKICVTCKVPQSEGNFGADKRAGCGLKSSCRECLKIYQRAFRAANVERFREYKRERYKKHKGELLSYYRNRESVLKLKRAIRLADLEGWRKREREYKKLAYARKPEKYLARAKAWRERNPERVIAARKRLVARPGQRLYMNISRAIRAAIGLKKAGRRWESFVGYRLEELMRHLEARFKYGMTWENYGAWEIDHIRPKSSFEFKESDILEIQRCWSLTNLQPLWMSENRKKYTNTL